MVPEALREELDIAELDMAALDRMQVPGVLSVCTCPECGGPLWEIRDGAFVPYGCHVGHALTARHLAALAERLAQVQRDAGGTLLRARFEAHAGEARGHAAALGNLLDAGPIASPRMSR